MGGLKSIGKAAFLGCSNLKQIIAPESLIGQIKQQVPEGCIVISHQEQRRNCQRQWLRAINSEHISQKIFLGFFKGYPGLRKFMGTRITLYYNPATADTFEEPTDSTSLQKEQTLLQPETSQVKSKSR